MIWYFKCNIDVSISSRITEEWGLNYASKMSLNCLSEKNYMLQYLLSVRVEEAYMAFWRLLSGVGTINYTF